MVPPPWRGARSILCLLNTLVSSLVIWCLTLILVLQPELSEQYKVQIHEASFTPPSKCWGCPPPARTTVVGVPQSTPPSWDRIRSCQIQTYITIFFRLRFQHTGSWINVSRAAGLNSSLTLASISEKLCWFQWFRQAIRLFFLTDWLHHYCSSTEVPKML